MVNAVEEGVQIEVNHPFLALFYLASRLVNGLMRIAIWPESVAVGVKMRFPDRGQHLRYRLLDEAVYNRGYSQLAFAAVRFGYLYPLNGLWSIVTVQKLTLDLGPVLFQLVG